MYQPKVPVIIDVPEMIFLMIDGKGDPNTSQEYANALEVLYGISYTIKMSKGTEKLEGYFEYVVPSLEVLWEIDDDTFRG